MSEILFVGGPLNLASSRLRLTTKSTAYPSASISQSMDSMEPVSSMGPCPKKRFGPQDVHGDCQTGGGRSNAYTFEQRMCTRKSSYTIQSELCTLRDAGSGLRVEGPFPGQAYTIATSNCVRLFGRILPKGFWQDVAADAGDHGTKLGDGRHFALVRFDAK